ncbi:methyl-accepting chemotaxis protein [Pelagibius marinus]|uniref:methyl-accepting chemotaxis protein n=1 Tax=Pelagibius marinus TaxID=2762760 RepID=UPI0018729509|nr:methyl-accepting chemotaxis protein [Pelagibius marinus]
MMQAVSGVATGDESSIAPPAGTEASGDAGAALAEAVRALTAGNYDIALGGEDGLTLALIELRDRLREDARHSLEATVSFSMGASQAMASISHVTDSMRRADERTQGMASAVEQMNSSIQQISDSGRVAAKEADHSLEAASDGVHQLDNAVSQMREITGSVASIDNCAERLVSASEQISGILATIDTLSKQTNLLALNATIEAARAGEHGKGFAVVSNEVKALAKQTADATDDIRQRILLLEQEVAALTDAASASREAADSGTKAIDEARERMGTIGDQVRTVNGHIREISSMLSEQSTAVQEISSSVSVIAELSDRNKRYADQAIEAVRQSETTVEDCFAELDKKSIGDTVLYRAKSDHYIWKKRLAEMLVGLNSLKADELADHHSCRLGKWYDKVDDAWFHGNQSFKSLVAPHERVHSLGKKAAEAYQTGRAEEAWKLYSEMDEASAEVVRLLDKIITGRRSRTE